MWTVKRPFAFVAVFALLGLGVSAAFVLPRSNASGTVTYPTKPPPPKTTQERTTTHEQEQTTTEETPAATEETTTLAATTTVALVTTTAPLTTTTAARVLTRIRLRTNARLHATVLVDQGGMTLYHFTKEKGRRVLCTGGCTSVWPPLLVGTGLKPLAGLGIKALRLGTIRRPDGKLQVTYMGFPLYRFSGDTKPGDAKGNGFGNVWFALGPSGRLIGG